ncbi:MAG: hypothetical protein R3E42_12950 [Burkholderiaceae bacterium]
MNSPLPRPTTPFLSAAESDPVAMGWMVGSPPPPDKRVRFADLFQFPKTRWSFAHMRSLAPSSPVSRGSGPVAALPAMRATMNAMPCAFGHGQPRHHDLAGLAGCELHRCHRGPAPGAHRLQAPTGR